MLLVADIHGAFDALAAVATRNETLLILGDLINFVDYRTGEGIAAEVFGPEFAARVVAFRAVGDFAASRRLWTEHSAGRTEEIRGAVGRHVRRQYEEMRQALGGGRGFVTHGNVDAPDLLRDHLPSGFTYVDGGVVEVDGLRVGMVGGGAPTGLNARGEVGEEEMAAKLEALGSVDVLCSHVAPAVPALQRDVITGRLEGGSAALVDYLRTFRPRFHYFGDVHQPQATRWRFGDTLIRNVGYFRATRRAVNHG